MPKTLENNRRCVSRCFLQANQAHAAAKQNDSRYQLQAWSPTQAPAAAHLRSIQIKSKKTDTSCQTYFFSLHTCIRSCLLSLTRARRKVKAQRTSVLTTCTPSIQGTLKGTQANPLHGEMHAASDAKMQQACLQSLK